ncbi:ATP-binding protein [Nocardioides sp.]|uniref:ATP-binding protein n=1 Tax=Nocardioides sp. TaxID=35761 RepID=UPI003515A6A5
MQALTSDTALPAHVRFADAALDLALLGAPERALGAAGDVRPPVAVEPESLARAQAAMARARADLAHDDEPTAFAAVCANAELDDHGREVLALLVACESDLVRTARVAQLTASGRGGHLTLGAIARLIGGVGLCAGATGPGSALQRSALITLVPHGPWSGTEVALAPSAMWAIAGDQSPDPELPLGSWMMEGPPPDPDTPVLESLVLVTGPDPVRRRQHAVERVGAEVYLVVPAPATPEEWAAAVREATITGSALLVELTGDLAPDGRRWLERARHLTWVLSSEDSLALSDLPDRPRSELVADDRVVTAEEWAAVFGPERPHTHRLTARQFEQVREALPAVGDDLDAAVRRLLAGPMGRLAQRIRPRKSWDDLVVSGSRAEQLRTIVARFRHARTVYDDWGVTSASGRGIVAMFSGPSGTGKSLAAEVIAHSLGLDLYKVDLSQVVSKYIGETEQNLDKLFAAASAGSAVLFFDEADSLFGKRAEVKDGRDRYANLEVSYLLQRLERYDGVVILATNLPKNIDDAFLRRIHEVVPFQVPGVEERRAIWDHHLRDGDVPLGEIDVDRLAQRFEVPGGIIRNAVVSGMFRAADEAAPLSMSHLLAALASEYQKLGRVLNPEDLHV